MNARCGLADCEYTIGGLLRRLELIIGNCSAGMWALVQGEYKTLDILRDAIAETEKGA